GVEFLDHLGVAPSGQQADVVTRAPEPGHLRPHGQLDPSWNRGRGVVHHRQRRPGTPCQAGSSNRVTSGGTRSTLTRTPSPHSTVKSSSPSPRRMPSTRSRLYSEVSTGSILSRPEVRSAWTPVRVWKK